MTITDTISPFRSRTDDDDLLALIAAEGEGLWETDRRRAEAIRDQIEALVPVTLRGILAVLNLSDYEGDPLVKSAFAGLSAIVEAGELQKPPASPPRASALQKLITVEWHIRSMGIKISDAADDFRYWFDWLEKQDQSVHELGAGMDDFVSEARNLYDRISEKANELFDRIKGTRPVTSLADAIALLEMDDPPIDAVIAGLRALAEKGGAV